MKQLIRLNTGGRLTASTANVRLGIMCFAPRKLPVIESSELHAQKFCNMGPTFSLMGQNQGTLNEGNGSVLLTSL